jgi:hypothetical protein
MKNVMLARQTIIGKAEVYPSASSGLLLLRTIERTSSRAATTCTLIAGTNEQQAQALAGLLRAARP